MACYLLKSAHFFELWPLETNKLCVFLRAWHFGDYADVRIEPAPIRKERLSISPNLPSNSFNLSNAQQASVIDPMEVIDTIVFLIKLPQRFY
jgi:hypothetical protein